MTDYLRPRSLDDALRARAEHPDYILLAGGTDLMVGHRDEPAGVIDLFGLGGLVGIELTDDGAVRIGAATTYRQLLTDELIATYAPALAADTAGPGASAGTSAPWRLLALIAFVLLLAEWFLFRRGRLP